MTISVLAAFLGGALALLSPCSALLMPAFFASSSGVGARLAASVVAFFAGLLTVLVPLGLGASAIGSFFTSYRSTLIWVAGVIIIGFGIMQVFSWGFDLQGLLPRSAVGAGTRALGLTRAYLLGVTGGVAGFCAGPILGAILTLAAASGSFLTGAILMTFYSAGMVAPLLVLVMIWHRTGIRGIARGRGFTIGGHSFHTTSVLTGLLLILVGVVFIATNGLLGLPEFVNLQTQASLQAGAQTLGTIGQIITIILLTAVALALWWWWPRESTEASPTRSKQQS